MRERLAAQRPVLRRSDDADDLVRHIRHRAADFAIEMFTNRVLVGEIVLSERLVDDHDRLCPSHIVVVEESSGAQRNAHRAEVIDAHLID